MTLLTLITYQSLLKERFIVYLPTQSSHMARSRGICVVSKQTINEQTKRLKNEKLLWNKQCLLWLASTVIIHFLQCPALVDWRRQLCLVLDGIPIFPSPSAVRHVVPGFYHRIVPMGTNVEWIAPRNCCLLGSWRRVPVHPYQGRAAALYLKAIYFVCVLLTL